MYWSVLQKKSTSILHTTLSEFIRIKLKEKNPSSPKNRDKQVNGYLGSGCISDGSFSVRSFTFLLTLRTDKSVILNIVWLSLKKDSGSEGVDNHVSDVFLSRKRGIRSDIGWMSVFAGRVITCTNGSVCK